MNGNDDWGDDSLEKEEELRKMRRDERDGEKRELTAAHATYRNLKFKRIAVQRSVVFFKCSSPFTWPGARLESQFNWKCVQCVSRSGIW